MGISLGRTGEGLVKGMLHNFQKQSPVTNILSRRRGVANLSSRTFQTMSLATEMIGRVPMYVADQLHQARLRLEFPDILAISEEGINIGMGIRIRKVVPEELGKISRPYWDHVRLFEIIGERSGLHAFIGVHTLMEVNGRLWCIGGTRMRNDYPSRDHALRDVLRLSRAMTYKSAAADIPIGGGKCNIIYDPHSPNKEAVLRDFAKALEYLKLIFTGQDMNISPQDARLMGLVAQHSIVGSPGYSMGGTLPTPPTAKGVFLAIQKAAKLHGIPMRELRVALQGLGGVGSNLVPYLVEAGAKVTATDINPKVRRKIYEKFGDKVTLLDDPEAIYDVATDVFSPSAKEDVLNDSTIPRIVKTGVKIIAGAANNPLQDDVKHAEQLREAGIFYYRDYVVNGGGLMGVASGVMGYDPMVKVEGIADSVVKLHQLMKSGKTGHEAGEIFAEERLSSWPRLTSQGWQEK